MAFRHHRALLLAPAIATSLFLVACGQSGFGSGAGSQTEMEGKLIVVAKSSALDAVNANPDRMPTVTYQAMIEYQPGHKAVIYTNSQTEFVKVKNTAAPLAYFPGGRYRITGTEIADPKIAETDGPVFVEHPVGVDKWIEVSRMEHLSEQENSPPD